jgi:hypothetical protein
MTHPPVTPSLIDPQHLIDFLGQVLRADIVDSDGQRPTLDQRLKAALALLARVPKNTPIDSPAIPGRLTPDDAARLREEVLQKLKNFRNGQGA